MIQVQYYTLFPIVSLFLKATLAGGIHDKTTNSPQGYGFLEPLSQAEALHETLRREYRPSPAQLPEAPQTQTLNAEECAGSSPLKKSDPRTRVRKSLFQRFVFPPRKKEGRNI